MLFLSADIIAPILTKFYNVSVQTETVISDWKLSKVTPLYTRKGSKDEAGNYSYKSDKPYHENIREINKITSNGIP